MSRSLLPGRRAVGALSKTSPRNWLELASKFVQLSAILAAGLWTIWMYYAHTRSQAELEHESKRLQNEQLALTLRQQSLLARGERERAQVTLEQQRLDLAMKRAVSEFETEHKRLGVDQQKAALQQAQLEKELLVLDRKLRDVEFRHVSQSPLKFSYQFEPDTTSLNGAGVPSKVRLRISVKNLSKNIIVIPEGELNIHIGQFAPPDGEYAVKENGPFHNGPIKWRRVQHIEYVSPEVAGWHTPTGTELGGVAFGRVMAGEEYNLDNYFLLNAPAGAYVAFTSGMRVEEPGKTPYRYEYQDLVQLKPSTPVEMVKQ
jgi:hypothetical protein